MCMVSARLVRPNEMAVFTNIQWFLAQYFCFTFFFFFSCDLHVKLFWGTLHELFTWKLCKIIKMPLLCGLQLRSLFCSILCSTTSVESSLNVLAIRHDVTIIMRVCVFCRMAHYLQGQVKESRRMEGEIWIDLLPGRVMLERSHCGPTIPRPLSVHLPNSCSTSTSPSTL